MKRRCIDVERKIINHHPLYYDAVNSVQNYLAALEAENTDQSDILVCLILLMREAEFCWKFKTGPAGE